MAVAAPARRSQSQTAPAPPARTAPPEPKKRPRDRPRPGGSGRSAGAAPATAPKRKPAAPKRKAQTAAPARKTAPKRRTGARVIPIAAGTVGRTAVAVTQLPESGLIHRLTRGRAWIGVLGLLLIGIVGLNVVTLSFAASAGKVDERIQALSRENSVLQSLQAKKYGQARVNHEAKKQGLSASMATEPTMVSVGDGNVGVAASRLAAAAGGTAAATSEGEVSAGEAAASGDETASGEEIVSGEEISATELEALSQDEKNRIYEETLAREAAEAEGVTSSEVSYESATGESVTEVPTE
jgi:hypothetical protein